MMNDVLALLEQGRFPHGGAVFDLDCGCGNIALAVARKAI
jgi:methylase of polypeptide subunit release factors